MFVLLRVLLDEEGFDKFDLRGEIDNGDEGGAKEEEGSCEIVGGVGEEGLDWIVLFVVRKSEAGKRTR